MIYTDTNNGLRYWRNLIGLVAAATILYVSITGCVTSKPVPPVYKPAENINLHFKRPLIIKMPGKDPVTVEEHIRCGLFYFNQERFAEADAEFAKARLRITDCQNPLFRACLISSAICYLVTDNRPAFIKTVQELKGTYNKYELMVIEKRDERVKVIFNLYDEFIKSGSHCQGISRGMTQTHTDNPTK